MLKLTALGCLFIALFSCAEHGGDLGAAGTWVRDQPTESLSPHLRVVWTRDLGDGSDHSSQGDQLALMAYDSQDGRGERLVMRDGASYAKPLITPDGASIVFSIRRQQIVYAIDWDGTNLRRLADGFGLDVLGRSKRRDSVGLRRRRPDVHRAAEVSDRPALPSGQSSGLRDGLGCPAGGARQLSAVRRRTERQWVVPLADRRVSRTLSTGTWRQLGDGCWTSFSPGEDSLFWYFDGAHRNVTIVDLDTEERWRVSISDDAVFGGYEVYHPRWTNHPRALVVTGPYTVGERANKIGGGGDQVEIYVGFFDETFTNISSWRRVTYNIEPDFYPDAWIEPGTLPARSVRVSDRREFAASASGDSRVVVEVRARRDVVLPTPASIAPYREGLLALEYEVENVLQGRLDVPVIAVAHWIIRDGRTVVGADRPAEQRYRLQLVPYDARPELEGKRLVMEVGDFTLPLFYDVESADLMP